MNGIRGPVAIGLCAAWSPYLATAEVPGFRGLRDPSSPLRPVSATAISADGQVVVGFGESERGVEAFLWIEERVQGLGDLPGGVFHSEAHSTSADGWVVVGVADYVPESDIGQAFRLSNEGPWVGLGFIEGDPTRNSRALDVSADGTVVVGGANYDRGYGPSEAFRWTSQSGMRGLGYLDPTTDCVSEARAIAANGSTIVGWSGCFGDGWDPPPSKCFQWTIESGMQPLQDSAGEVILGEASDVTADGSVIVGTYLHGFWGAFLPVAFRWSLVGGLEPLGPFGSRATSVSADGALIVGATSNDMLSQEASLWDAIHGPRQIKPLLLAMGLEEVSAWTLSVVTGISADGRTIVGNGLNSSGESEPWIAHLQWTGDIDKDLDVDLSDLANLLSSFALCAGDAGFLSATDLDASGCVDLADLGILLGHFGS